MKAMIALLFLAAVAVYARAEMEYHPQAILHYLEMEDHEMAKKVRSIVKLSDPHKVRPSFRPSGFPTNIPPKVVSTHIRLKRECNQKSKGCTYFFMKFSFEIAALQRCPCKEANPRKNFLGKLGH